MASQLLVTSFPDCAICKFVGPPPGKHAQPAGYDGKTTEGPWAYMCSHHFKQYGVGLGTGKGQRLILAPPP